MCLGSHGKYVTTIQISSTLSSPIGSPLLNKWQLNTDAAWDHARMTGGLGWLVLNSF